MNKKTRVLMVDDEPNVLSGYRRSIGRKLDLTTANGGQEALEVLDRDGPFEVVITDMRTPEMDGLEILKQAQSKHPKTVYVMLTGNADQQTAIDAINHGQIYRFLNKPCDPEILEHTILACKSQYDLIHAEADLLNNTLSGSVKLLIEAMVVSDPAAAETIRTVRENVGILCKGLGLQQEWRFPLAASLFIIGGITVPRTSSKQLLDDLYISDCAESGSKLLRHIPRLEQVAQMVLQQRKQLELPQDLDELTDESRIAVGSQLLRFAYDWYRASVQLAGDRQGALQSIASDFGKHDRRLSMAALNAYGTQSDIQAPEPKWEQATLGIRELREGMVTQMDIQTQDESLLVAKGQTLTQLIIDRLRGFYKAGLIEDEVRVKVQVEEESAHKRSA